MQLTVLILVACLRALVRCEAEQNNAPVVFKVANKTRVLPLFPDYVGALETFDQSTDALTSLMPHEEVSITDPRRHYIIIAGVIAVLAEYLNSDCTPPDYNHQYIPAVDRLLPIIWDRPDLVVHKLETFIEDANRRVSQIKQAKESYCKNIRKKLCNAILLVIADNRQEFIDNLELVSLLGELAEAYDSTGYFAASEHFGEATLLLEGRAEMEPVVRAAARVYNKMYGTRCVYK